MRFRAITLPAGREGGALGEAADAARNRRARGCRAAAAADAAAEAAQQAAQDRLEQGVAGRLQGDLGHVEGQALEHVAKGVAARDGALEGDEQAGAEAV
ncbi:MAG: hypothetical protein O7I42_04645 [Alphaproteobacteria bacterium]|nr:hypothetical protein [Alphaproteobacteria bacterium]